MRKAFHLHFINGETEAQDSLRVQGAKPSYDLNGHTLGGVIRRHELMEDFKIIMGIPGLEMPPGSGGHTLSLDVSYRPEIRMLEGRLLLAFTADFSVTGGMK